MEVKTLNENTYLNLLKDINTKKSKVGEQEYLAEAKGFEKAQVQIVSIEGKIYWIPFPLEGAKEARSLTNYTYRIENYDSLKKVGGISPAYSFGKWRELPRLHKAIKQRIVDLIESGTCMMERGSIITKPRKALYKNFSGFKDFPSNTVIEFKLKILSNLRTNLPGQFGSPWFKFKGTAKRIR